MFIRRTLFVLLFALCALSIGVWFDYQAFLTRPLPIPAEGQVLEIPRGTSLRTLARQMTDQGLLAHPYYFIALAYQQRDQSRVKAGEFQLTEGMTPAQALRRITSGQVIQHPITLVEGWTFRRAVEVIDAAAPFDGTLGSLSDAALMEQIGQSGEHPEGRLFPDTYHFPRHTARLEILRRAWARMDQVLAEEWARRQPDLPIRTPYEALILASIIEKETAVAIERPQIAGVFVRRLQRGMRLQTDPTVIYGLGARYDGNLRRSDLREANPYNTYVIQGLPPTPIALPGRAAIQAALQPADGEAIYFVARGDGSHVFSVTLDEHNRAVRQYILGTP